MHVSLSEAGLHSIGAACDAIGSGTSSSTSAALAALRSLLQAGNTLYRGVDFDTAAASASASDPAPTRPEGIDEKHEGEEPSYFAVLRRKAVELALRMAAHGHDMHRIAAAAEMLLSVPAAHTGRDAELLLSSVKYLLRIAVAGDAASSRGSPSDRDRGEKPRRS